MTGLPSDWGSVALGSLEARGLLVIRNGFSCGDHSADSSGVAHLRPFNVTEDCRLSFTQMKYIAAQPGFEDYTLQSDDILYNNTNSEELVGKCAHWAKVGGGHVLSNHMTILRLKPDIDLSPRFLNFYLFWLWQSGGARMLCRRHVNQASIGLERLRQIEVPLPPRDEQDRICDLLGIVLRSTEVQEDLVATTSALKASAMAQFFQHGLRGAALADTELGPLPANWRVVKLGAISKVGNGSTPSRSNEEYWRDGTIPWITSTKVHDVIIDEADEFVTEVARRECHLPLVPRDSLVVAITGQGKTLGNAAILRLDTCINQHLAYIRFSLPSIHPEFFLFYLQSRYQYFRQVSSAGGSTKGALTCGFLAGMSVPLPPIDEQQEIAETLLRLTQRQRIADRCKGTYSGLFRTLLHEVMTGSLRISSATVPEVLHA